MLKKIFLFIPALLTIIVWGSTFLVSKNVLLSGMHPLTLMCLRFLLAYIILCMFSKKPISFKFDRVGLKQELLFLLLGLSGGSLYFYLEYTSLKMTSAVNVGLISATVPIISTAISLVLGKVKVGTKYYCGSLFAFLGVFFIVMNGRWCFSISIIGDLIAILSAFLWALYTVILSLFENKYSEILISRRLFFYAFITIIGFVIYRLEVDELYILREIPILLSVLYLAIFASALCMLLWNISINKIGIIKTNNFLYFMPVVTLLASLFFAIDEISLYSVLGTVLIIVGIYISDYKS